VAKLFRIPHFKLKQRAKRDPSAVKTIVGTRAMVDRAGVRSVIPSSSAMLESLREYRRDRTGAIIF
jgi:hypothetical protein